MKKTNFIIATAAAAAALLNLSSCHKHDEGELITTVKLTLTPSGGASKTYVWSDPDGIGGNAPKQADTLICDSGMVYSGELQFFNGDNDITSEIKNEGKEHFVCYSGPTTDVLEITYKDSDGKYAIGLSTEFKAGKKSSGLLRTTLKHQAKNKNGTCDRGETDVDVTFPFLIK